MKTVSFRMLLRDPQRIKAMTERGEPVLVAENRRPLWILMPANQMEHHEAERLRAIDELLDEVLRAKPSKISAARLLDESRR